MYIKSTVLPFLSRHEFRASSLVDVCISRPHIRTSLAATNKHLQNWPFFPSTPAEAAQTSQRESALASPCVQYKRSHCPPVTPGQRGRSVTLARWQRQSPTDVGAARLLSVSRSSLRNELNLTNTDCARACDRVMLCSKYIFNLTATRHVSAFFYCYATSLLFSTRIYGSWR